MKKILSFLFLFTFSMSIVAQSYDQLWTKASKAAQADLPKSALALIQQIQQKAIAEKNDAQLLKSSLAAMACGVEIAPDSVNQYIRQMEQALAVEKRPLEQALWHSALAQVYAAYDSELREKGMPASIRNEHCKEHFKASLQYPELLIKVQYSDYLPLFAVGAESVYFNNDLLHILYRAYERSNRFNNQEKLEMLKKIIPLYRAQGNRQATLLLAQEYFRKLNNYGRVKGLLEENAYYKALTYLAEHNQDKPANMQTYLSLAEMRRFYDIKAEYAAHNDSLLLGLAQKALENPVYKKQKEERSFLKNFIETVNAPQVEFGPLREVYYPGIVAQVKLGARNIQQLKLRIVSVYDKSIDNDKSDDATRDKITAKHSKHGSVYGYTLSGQPYRWEERQVNFIVPEKPGVYCAELMVGKKTIAREYFHVSALRPLVYSLERNPQRIVVVDSRTGHPVPNAVITACRTDGRQQLKVYHSADGIFQMPEGKYFEDDVTYYVSTEADYGSKAFTLYSNRYYRRPEAVRTHIYTDLFTDRAIYRPGQKIDFSGVIYSRDSDLFQTLSAQEMRVRMYNANHKAIDSLLVRSDEFGTFSGTFNLPEHCLSGYFHLEAQAANGRRNTLLFRVEEYKRPTFTVATLPVREAYRLNDSVRVEGDARTYSDVPIANARVSYRVERTSWYSRNEGVKPQHGEVRTDEKGHFSLPVHLSVTEVDTTDSRYNRFFYKVNYTVTAENGENVQGSIVLHAATRAARFEASVPEILCKENLSPFKVNLYNAANENVEAQAVYVLRKDRIEVARGMFVPGVPFSIDSLRVQPSGKYELEVFTTSNVEKDTIRFVLISENDTKVADRSNPFLTYKRSNAASDSTLVLIGTPEKNALVYYDLIAQNRVVESRTYELSDSVLRMALAYRPEYGDGARACFAMVYDEEMHTFEAEVKKPLPDKRLNISWTSFRSRLVPGQQEEWRLQITRPDGTPVQANLMARMYDASLDALTSHNWRFGHLGLYRSISNANWQWQNLDNTWKTPLLGYAPIGYPNLPQPVYTRWRQDLFNYRYTELKAVETYEPVYRHSLRRGILTKANGSSVQLAVSSPSLAIEEKAGGDMSEMGAEPAADALRSNFAETAFFRPALRTDGKGQVSIAFTLPESMTRWNFSALAHDVHMNHGRLDTTLVARKEFMVQPALPRLVRYGDLTRIPVKVTNLTASRIKASLRFVLEDGLRDRRVLRDEKQTIRLAPNETRVFTFTYMAVDDTPLLVCRTTAQGNGFSDGEEHYLPVFSSLVEVTRSIPFTLRDSDNYEFRIDTLFKAKKPLHRVLGVELSSNPAWYAVSALPVLSDNRHSLSATDWATSYYALTIGRRIASLNPELEQTVKNRKEEIMALSALKLDKVDDSTPWLSSAENEARRYAALYQLFDEESSLYFEHTALDKLRALQLSDGSWSWCPGMKGNNYITLEVAVLLARVQRLTGNYDATLMLRKAYDYLHREINEQVAEQKKMERKTGTPCTPTELQLRYLYLMMQMGERPDNEASYLLDRVAVPDKRQSMYAKALTSLVLAEFGRDAAARTALQSLMEHTVSTPEAGRYFDTSRAERDYAAYRIPTQCVAIEALSFFGREEEAAEMRLWLLRAKRTQLWETSQASTDAVYALLSGAGKTYSVTNLAEKQPLTYTLLKGNKAVAAGSAENGSTPQTAGYIKQRYTETPAVDATSLCIGKKSSGMAWGSVYATYTLPMLEVSTEGRELKMNRRFEVEQADGWKWLQPGQVLKKGDRVRQVFTLSADRDFDFVKIDVRRPACFEPVRALSGYRFGDDFAAYCAVRDFGSDYFIEHLHKGTSILREEYVVDRTGQYSTGISRVECIYAPEFNGTVGALSLTVE